MIAGACARARGRSITAARSVAAAAGAEAGAPLGSIGIHRGGGRPSRALGPARTVGGTARGPAHRGSGGSGGSGGGTGARRGAPSFCTASLLIHHRAVPECAQDAYPFGYACRRGARRRRFRRLRRHMRGGCVGIMGPCIVHAAQRRSRRETRLVLYPQRVRVKGVPVLLALGVLVVRGGPCSLPDRHHFGEHCADLIAAGTRRPRRTRRG